MATPLEVFCCYAREDQEMLEQLKKHLTPLQRQGQITIWSDTNLNAGVEWEKELHRHLESADIILLLISPDFMASDYCYSTEMRRAIERHDQGRAHVVPIILRPTFWRGAPFAKIQVLPKDARPVKDKGWFDSDEAFNDITERIYQIVSQLSSRPSLTRANPSLHPTQPKPVVQAPTKEQWLVAAKEHFDADRDAEALAAYEQVIRLDSNDATAYTGKSRALNGLQRYEEALAASDQAIRLDPNLALAYYSKGVALDYLQRYEEALAAYDHAIRLDPNDVLAYNNKSAVLRDLQHYEEALATSDQAIRLDPNEALAYFNKGDALYNLQRYGEALVASDQAIRLDPNYALTYNNKGNTLYNLQRYGEALIAYEQTIRLDPNLAFAYNNKGNALRMLGRQGEAQQAYEKARQLGFKG